MENVPDAPYITDAERHGIWHPRKIECPVCGEMCETIYGRGCEALGCEHCVDVMDAEDWEEEGRD